MTQTWLDAYSQRLRAKDYASALAMLRAPAPETHAPVTTAPTQVGQSAILNVQVHDEQNPRKSPRGEA
jgi:hypothetical protein